MTFDNFGKSLHTLYNLLVKYSLEDDIETYFYFSIEDYCLSYLYTLKDQTVLFLLKTHVLVAWIDEVVVFAFLSFTFESYPS